MAFKEGDGEQLARELRVEGILQPERLDRYLSRILDGVSRSSVKKWIQSDLCQINDQTAKASDLVHEGDTIRLLKEGPKQAKPALFDSPRAVPLDILYEDSDVLVLNKQAGLIVHPGAATIEPTLVEGVLHYLQARAEELPGEPDRPGIVHRLDQDTTGAMVICKTAIAHEHLSRQFHDKTNLREYIALLDGFLAEDEYVVESYLCRDERNRLRRSSVSIEEYSRLLEDGKNVEGYRWAKTLFYREVSYQQRLSLVSARLATGRTHQIRVHALALRTPVLGDQIYRRQSASLDAHFPPPVVAKLRDLRRQMLHARKLGFKHPRTGEEIAFVAPLPEDFRKVLEILSESGQVMRR